MHVEAITRYPVKSMLGQPVEQVLVGPTGLADDRGWGLVDDETGRVATAKNPRRWRRLLQYSAVADDHGVVVTSPDGVHRRVEDPALVDELSRDLGRAVSVSSRRSDGAEVERSVPEEVLERGVDAEVSTPTLAIAAGSPGHTFVDHSPVHVIASATLHRLGVDPVRYRPNLVLACEGEPFVENDWVGHELQVGDDEEGVVLRIALPTPRCSVPTLEHGPLPRAPEAVRPLMSANLREIPELGASLPCAGVYAEVVRPGTIRRGDRAVVRAATGTG